MNSQDYFLLKALCGWQGVDLVLPELPPAPPGALQSIDEVMEHLDGIRTASLDIFDTLLRRDVEPAHYPKRAAMEQLHFQLSRTGIDIPLSRLLRMREEAEAEARQDSLARGHDAECTLGEIFEILYRMIASAFHVDLHNALPVATLVTYEVGIELERLSPMPGAQSLLKQLKQRGIRILLLSDMYLEEEHLRMILAHHGLLEWVDALYVSSETRHSKGSGRLFQRLIEQGVIVPQETLHMGDHPVSDYAMPQLHGLRACLLHNEKEQRRRLELKHAMKLLERAGDSTHLLHLTDMEGIDDPAETPYQIGYRRLGPVFTLFALDVLQQVLREGYREVFFLARDGYLIQKLYQCLRDGLDLAAIQPTVEGKYLYLSRASTQRYSLDDGDEELTSLAQRVNRQQGVWALLDVLGLERSPYHTMVEEIIAQYGSAEELEMSGELQRRLLQQERFRQQLKQDVETNRQRLHDYLEQEGFFGPGRVLLVDIGWNGSIVSNIEHAFGHEEVFPEVDVRLFGRIYGTQFDYATVAEGFAYDEHRSNPLEHLINECRELFESVSSSPEGSVLGYREAGGMIVPRCAATVIEEKELAIVEEIQNGVLAYCNDFVRMYNRFRPAAEALKYEAIVQATSLITARYPDEISVISDLMFDLSWGTEGRVSMKEYLGLVGSKKNPGFSMQKLDIVFADDSLPQTHTQKFFEQIHQMVERLSSEKRLIIYGVGTVASLIAPLLADKIAYFVDANQALHEKRFLGKKVYSPDKLMEETEGGVFVTPVNRKSVIARRLENCSLEIFYIDDFV